MRCYGVLAVLLLLGAGAAPAMAQYAGDDVRAGPVEPLDRILPHIRNSRPGTFYDAEGPFEGPDGRMHYRLKWMTPQGRIIWLDTDARTGRVLGEARGYRRPSWERGPEPGERRRYAPRDNGPGDWRDKRRDERQDDVRDRPRPFDRPDGYGRDGYGSYGGQPYGGYGRDRSPFNGHDRRQDRGGSDYGGGRRGGGRHGRGW